MLYKSTSPAKRESRSLGDQKRAFIHLAREDITIGLKSYYASTSSLQLRELTWNRRDGSGSLWGWMLGVLDSGYRG